MSLLILIGPAKAHTTDPTSNNKRIYTTQRIQGVSPIIDGDINDPIWESAEWQGDFTVHFPNNGEKPTHQTQFKVLFDDDYIYIAIKIFH